MTPFSALSRRNFMAGTSALLAASAVPALSRAQGAHAQGLTPLTTALGWIPNAEYAGLWVALERGYFAQEGIEGLYTPGGPNAPGVLVQLAAGQADFAGGDWVPLLEARARGNDFIVLGCNFPTSPAAIMSMGDAPVLTPADLVGKRILSQLPADANTLNFVLDKAGIAGDFELVATGFSPEPLLAGDGDAYMAYATNQPITFENMGLVEGKDFHVTLFSDLGYTVPGAPIVASRAFVQENRALVVGYLRALLRGWIENGKDPAFGATLAVEKYGADFGLDLDQQIRQSTLGQPLISAKEGLGPFWFDPALVESVIAPVAAASGIEQPVLADELVDLTPLQEALASL
ncbi:NMT1/THI5 like protein [Aquimixticola soesokkakensis]|uniref:Thiamine pyrimidine synthase n=1 Tax=Aquimixticola soesokkakensis TaxID=1519096 RepID=A0A1Y5T971_9RHOB|nr:ABC transporter substrate-binding protein [Aquimixticola soesokkakensis]SLN55145.1 NMT1/THI5 like protein [Aquimixticola soesokkakensis]